MRLAVTCSVPTVSEAYWGEKNLEKVVTFLRMPSQTPIHIPKGEFDLTKIKGGVHPPHPLKILPAHSSPHLPNKYG